MNKLWIRIGIASFTLSLLICSISRAESKESEENEQKMEFGDVPKPVRKTIKREAEGAKVKSVDLEMVKGKKVYEADAEIDGINYEILVASDGHLLSKAVDSEDDEKPAAKAHKNSEDEDDEKPAAKAHKNSEDEDDDKPAAKAHKDSEDEDDDKPAAKSHKESKDEDDDKPAAKSHKESKDEDEDNDKPAVKSHKASEGEHEDKPDAK